MSPPNGTDLWPHGNKISANQVLPLPSGSPVPGPRSRLQSGFTLVEVLVAMLLLSLLMAGAWGGIHAATKAIHSGDRAIELTNRLRVTQQFLRRQLSHTMPLAFGIDDATGSQFLFQGEEDFMRFVAPMPGYLSNGGAYVQTLELSRGKGGKQLVFTNVMLNGFDLDEMSADDLRPVLLIDGMADAHFQYRGLDDQGELEDWNDEWEDPSRLPVMVRIEMEMAEGSSIAWPTMVIPLMLDVGSMHRVRRSMPGRGQRPPPPPPLPQPNSPQGK